MNGNRARRQAHHRRGRMDRPLRGGAGFTIVEVLVAAVILSLGLVALMSFSSYTVKEFNQSKKISMATTLARQELDSLRALAYEDLELGDATYMATEGAVQLWVTRVVEKPKANLKKVTVAVVDDDSKEYQRYTTYVYNQNAE